MSEEFILKACTSFRRSVDRISKKKKKKKMTAILSKCTLLYSSFYFVVAFFSKLNLILLTYKSRLLLYRNIPKFASTP